MSEELPADPTPTTPPTTPATPPDPAEMRKAYNVFRKRLKSMQLETDSKLGRSPLTGRKETLTAIQAPTGFGKAVWEHLTDAGYLKYEGRGLYTLLKKEWGAP